MAQSHDFPVVLWGIVIPFGPINYVIRKFIIPVSQAMSVLRVGAYII